MIVAIVPLSCHCPAHALKAFAQGVAVFLGAHQVKEQFRKLG